MALPTLTSNLLIRKACPALTSDHVGTNPIIISERPSTYIHLMREHIPLLMEGLYTYIHPVRKHIPLLMEGLCTYIHPVREHIPLLMEGLCTYI